jgi:tRNA nucleotidyltransferase (CCA-adding enzyme)
MAGRKIDDVLSSVLPRISPAQHERLEDMRLAAKLIDRITPHMPSGAEVMLAGSMAKGTNLSENHEFDIFLLFPKEGYSHDKMTEEGMRIAKKAMKGSRTEIGYAEHPYLKVFFPSHRADIVPAFKISKSEDRGSSVDRSQLHTTYINGKMTDEQKGDVRLLKKFLKAQGVYGAELRVEGFSGYLCELLILHHGSFEKLLEAAGGWKHPVIDIEKHHTEDLRKLFDSPMIVIDPVDRRRNVAAVVSRTSLYRFVLAARQFLASPSEEFFFPKKAVVEKAKLLVRVKQRKTAVLGLTFPAPMVAEDILWPQLKKAALAIKHHLEDLDFLVFGYYYWSDSNICLVMYELDNGRLPAVKKSIGPAVYFGKDADSFLKKHEGAYNLHVEHERLVSVEKRHITDADAALRDCIRNAAQIGIPKNFLPKLKKARIIGTDGIVAKFPEIASDYFMRKIRV